MRKILVFILFVVVIGGLVTVYFVRFNSTDKSQTKSTISTKRDKKNDFPQEQVKFYIGFDNKSFIYQFGSGSVVISAKDYCPKLLEQGLISYVNLIHGVIDSVLVKNTDDVYLVIASQLGQDKTLLRLVGTSKADQDEMLLEQFRCDDKKMVMQTGFLYEEQKKYFELYSDPVSMSFLQSLVGKTITGYMPTGLFNDFTLDSKRIPVAGLVDVE